jgi:chromosome segregation ATPase
VDRLVTEASTPAASIEDLDHRLALLLICTKAPLMERARVAKGCVQVTDKLLREIRAVLRSLTAERETLLQAVDLLIEERDEAYDEVKDFEAEVARLREELAYVRKHGCYPTPSIAGGQSPRSAGEAPSDG